MPSPAQWVTTAWIWSLAQEFHMLWGGQLKKRKKEKRKRRREKKQWLWVAQKASVIFLGFLFVFFSAPEGFHRWPTLDQGEGQGGGRGRGTCSEACQLGWLTHPHLSDANETTVSLASLWERPFCCALRKSIMRPQTISVCWPIATWWHSKLFKTHI